MATINRLNVTNFIETVGGQQWNFNDIFDTPARYKINLTLNYYYVEGTDHNNTTFRVIVVNNGNKKVSNIANLNGNGTLVINDEFSGRTEVNISLIVGKNDGAVSILPGTSLNYKVEQNESVLIEKKIENSSSPYKILIIVFIVIVIVGGGFFLYKFKGKPKMSFSKRVTVFGRDLKKLRKH